MTNKVDSILVLNLGSSSIKFQLFSISHDLKLIIKGQILNLYQSPIFECDFLTSNTPKQVQKLPLDSSLEDSLRFISNWLNQINHKWNIMTVAHRIVHGGREFSTHTLINEEVYIRLKSLAPLAPLHQEQNLKAIEIMKHHHPNIIQIACFDTVFHRTRFPIYTEYALPKKIRDYGIQKYGFHGLSYEWIVHCLKRDFPNIAEGRIIAAHLGNGSSLCAIKNGTSIDTTMGFTPLEGLVMGTRCGSIDPSIVTYLINKIGYTCEEVEQILNNESGLLGLSEISHDLRVLEQSHEYQAKFALDYYCTKVAQMIGMMIVALGGIDAIIFTGGVGENSILVRENIQKYLSFLPPFEARVIKANEEWIMAKHAIKLLKSTSKLD